MVGAAVLTKGGETGWDRLLELGADVTLLDWWQLQQPSWEDERQYLRRLLERVAGAADQMQQLLADLLE